MFYLNSKRAGKLTPADPDYIYLAPSMQQRLDDSAKPFDPKTEVWIADAKETFIAGNESRKLRRVLQHD